MWISNSQPLASPDLLVRSASACLDRPEAFCWQCLLEGARGRMWECRDFSIFYGTNRACYSSLFCHILPWSSKSNRSIPCAEEACLLHIGTLPKVCFPWVASPSSCKHWKWSLSATTGASIRDSNEQDAYFLVKYVCLVWPQWICRQMLEVDWWWLDLWQI